MKPTKKIQPKIPGGGDTQIDLFFVWRYCPDCCYREMVPQVPVPSSKCVFCGEGNCKLGED